MKFLTNNEGKAGPNPLPGVQMQVYGRGNNAYRWAGETDVFEAMADVRTRFAVPDPLGFDPELKPGERLSHSLIDRNRVVLRGFSMGGAVSVGVAGHETVAGVLGLAPWIPDQLELDGLDGKRFDVVHGAWDRWLPGVPGVSPAVSRRGFERARARGVEGTYTLLERALHGAAVRRPSGELVRLPRWRAWVDQVDMALGRFAGAVAS